MFLHEKFEARLSGCHHGGGMNGGASGGGGGGSRTGNAGGRDGGMRDAAGADRGQPGSASASNTGNGGGAAAAGQAAAQRSYKDPEVGGLVTGYGAPIHTLTPNPISSGISMAANPEKHAINQDKMHAYNSAARDWNSDLIQNNVLGWALPFGLQNVAPRFDQPATYTGGTYHFGDNPAAALGSLASIAGPGLGTLASTILGKGYSLADGKNLVFSGPAAPESWSKFSGENTGTAPKGPQSTSATPSGATARTGQATGIPGPMQPAPLPSIFGPQQSQAPAPDPSLLFPQQQPTQSRYQVPGGMPYGIDLFRRAA